MEQKKSCVNIQISASWLSLPFSQFQVSARATKAAVTGVKLAWLDRSAVSISGWSEKSFLLWYNQSNSRFMPFTWPVYKLQDNKSTKSKQDVQGSRCVSRTPPLGCRCKTPMGFCSNFQPRWYTCSEQSRTNYKTESHNTICCVASWWH